MDCPKCKAKQCKPGMMEPDGVRFECGSESINGFAGNSFRQSWNCRMEANRWMQITNCRLTTDVHDTTCG